MGCYKTISFILLLGLWNGLAEGDENKYSAIPQRNAFNLREPEPPKPTEQPPPPIDVKLTGITTILDSKRVFLLVKEQGKQQPAETKILKEGEKDGEIEVVQINEVDGEVKIINSGKEVTLNFEKDGVKLPSAPATATTTPPVPGGRTIIPLPGAIPANYGGFTNTPSANVSIQGRTIPPNPYAVPGYQPPKVNPGVNPSTVPSMPSIPRQVRLPGSKN